jgi:hypothetical protein
MTDLVERLRAPVTVERHDGLLIEAADEVERLQAALREITTHWANSYDHPHADTEMYRGPYGTGVVDGHRACTRIARRALGEAKDE